MINSDYINSIYGTLSHIVPLSIGKSTVLRIDNGIDQNNGILHQLIYRIYTKNIKERNEITNMVKTITSNDSNNSNNTNNQFVF